MRFVCSNIILQKFLWTTSRVFYSNFSIVNKVEQKFPVIVAPLSRKWITVTLDNPKKLKQEFHQQIFEHEIPLNIFPRLLSQFCSGRVVNNV